MNWIYFLGSINKLSLIAFLITLLFLAYEVYLFKKEKASREKPRLPAFGQVKIAQPQQAKVLVTNKPVTVKKPIKGIFIILIVLVVLFAAASIIGYLQISNYKKTTVIPLQSNENFVTSKGIKVFDEQFREIADDQLVNLKPDDTIIIGIHTVEGVDIDMARIRVNDIVWRENYQTKEFDNQHQIFYIKYKIPREISQLKIEAQLHSASDGWLGE